MNSAGCGYLNELELELWLDGRLPPERLQQIEQHARQCGACALLMADVGTLRGAADGVSEEEQRQFSARRPMLEARLKRSVRPVRRAAWWWTGVASAAAMVSLFLLLPHQQPRGVVMLGDRAVEIDPLPYRAAPLLRGARDANAWESAATAYREGDYSTAGKQFEAISEREPDSVDAALYSGIAFFFDGRTAQAKRLLETASERAVKQEQPLDPIAYYQGVVALALGDNVEARRQLTIAAEGAAPWNERAQALLSQL
ncbi:MAG: tetratricopeptide repeat protein [Acidobacteriota bacterium]